MTREFEDMLYFFAAGTLGKKYVPDHEVNIEKIYTLAIQQGVWQTVYIAMSPLYDLSKYEKAVLSDISINYTRIYFMFDVVKTLEAQGIPCCFLKGISVSRFYKEPSCRISSDTDILVKEQDLKKACDILKSLGFTLEANVGKKYHIESNHPVGGVLEIHVDLYQQHVKDMLFKNILKFNEPHINISVEGNEFKILGINDGLNHLTAHYIKHFISQGSGIRQLMDLLLYMKFYNDNINWEEYKLTWESLGFYELIEKLKGIGVVYFGLDFSEYNTEYLEEMLTDIEEGGAFGAAEDGRNDFLDIFLAEKNKNDLAGFKSYMKRDFKERMINRFFPNQSIMLARGYSYASKGKLFLYIAYLHRCVDLFIKVLKREKNLEETMNYKVKNVKNEIEADRIEMLKKIGVIK